MEETISLQEIFTILKKRLGMILTIFFVMVGITSFVTFFVMDKQYSSSVQLIAKLPTNEGQNSNINDVNFNLQMINTYKDFINSNVVLEDVQTVLEDEINYTGDISQIRGMLSVEQNTNSQMFTIKATTEDPKLAQLTANTVSEVFQEKSVDLLSIDKVSIMSQAPLNTNPVSPNTKLNLLIGSVLGLMLGAGLAFLLELLDKTVKDQRYIEDIIGMPVLGVIPEMTDKELKAKVQLNPKDSINTEMKRTRRARV
ncbi:YveK family protein [Vagococcus zengguangii]|uniref:Capsular polysaccharide biosynthesis protein CpsC n=1 Tax=Vagococcus zengguangii TaxID=2571750 RepID=A0A4D7CX91_9ENTE|nr:Wzz/FepE/Etk N-terminal domain-containing protein [Vagococcus zengguangii]QCI87021.1 tyrosine protein kinase [Vagococcus zengguangii]